MGALILGREDDGTLKLIRADEDIEIDDQFVEDIPSEGHYRLEGKVLKVDTNEGLIAYLLTEHDQHRHVWRAVRTADRPGR